MNYERSYIQVCFEDAATLGFKASQIAKLSDERGEALSACARILAQQWLQDEMQAVEPAGVPQDPRSWRALYINSTIKAVKLAQRKGLPYGNDAVEMQYSTGQLSKMLNEEIAEMVDRGVYLRV